MLKLSKFTLDPGEPYPICESCHEVIKGELAEVSTQAGYFHETCGLKVADNVKAWHITLAEYVKAKGGF